MQFIQIVIYILQDIILFIITILINKAFVYKLPVILKISTDNIFQKLKDI